ncbi:MAG: hypothetical protein PHV20_05210 [Bacteroidales bacterium]|nr:hypothetical protein [Bacteroidales bacterium]
MKFSKWSIVLFVIFLFAQNTNAQNRAEWLDSVIIDGNTQDWKNALHYFDKTSTMRYGFGNDERYLYLAFDVIEPSGQMRIMRGGLTISLKTKIKPKVAGTLKLSGHKPDKESVDQMSESKLDNSNPNQVRNNRMDILKNLYLMAKPNIQTDGFLKSKETLTSGEGGVISFDIKWNKQNQMILECRVPLSELFGENFDLAKICTKDITLQVIQSDDGNHMGGSFRAGMGGEGGRRMGGGYGNRNGGMEGNRSDENGTMGEQTPRNYPMYEGIDFKNSIVLAKQK